MTVDPRPDADGLRAVDDAHLRALETMIQASPATAVETARALLVKTDVPLQRAQLWTIVGRALYELGDTARAVSAIRRILPELDAVTDAADAVGLRISA